MAKSRFLACNQAIAARVTSGFQKINNTVLGAYTKIEDKFVDQYLTREGETIAQAKQRLAQQHSRRS